MISKIKRSLTTVVVRTENALTECWTGLSKTLRDVVCLRVDKQTGSRQPCDKKLKRNVLSNINFSQTDWCYFNNE